MKNEETTTAIETVNVTEGELVKMLMAITGPKPATITATTEVKMNKTNNPYHERVTKRQVSNVFINFSYTNSVNKKLVKEGKEADFVAKPRVWGVHVPGTPLITHKNEFHLEAGFITKNTPKAEYMLDGVVTDKAVFETYLPAKTENKSQGLDEEVVIRTFKICNIESVRVNGKLYVVTRK